MSADQFTLADMLDNNARRYRNHLALITEDGEERSFGELAERVDRLAAGLFESGLGAVDRLSVIAFNSAAYVELYLACARLGAGVCPINWRLSQEEVMRLLERIGPKALVVDESAGEILPEPLPPTVDRHLKFSIGASDRESFAPLEDSYRRAGSSQKVTVEASAPFAVLATAAVDVIPRGAVLSHGNLLASNLQESATLHLTPADRHLLALPLFHISALSHCLAFMHAGGANVVMPRFEAEEAVRLIDRHDVTHLSDFPPILSNLLDAAEAQDSRLPSLKHVTGLDSRETIERLQSQTGATFWTGFGQAETTGFVTLQRADERPGASGLPGELCRVEVVDEYDRPLPAGSAGEIVVRGPLVFQGYDGEPEISAYTGRGGWHHTGDVGRFDDDGYLHYVKRMAEKELIKPGGENVYPAEVETVIVELEGVDAACVFGVPDPKWGEAIKAVVESSDDHLDATRVIEHVGRRIARFKRPHHVVFCEALPRSEDGSVDRQAVKERWQS